MTEVMNDTTLSEETNMSETPDPSVSEQHSTNSYGQSTGRVVRYFNRKGYGFVLGLESNQKLFVHNSEIRVTDTSVYRKLFPGEYISYTSEGPDDQGRYKCTNVKGIMGHELLTESEEYNYRYYPKEQMGTYGEDRYGRDRYGSDRYDTDTSTVNDGHSVDDEEEASPKEFINKEAPEGLEVAEFDGLNISESMS